MLSNHCNDLLLIFVLYSGGVHSSNNSLNYRSSGKICSILRRRFLYLSFN